MRKHPYRVYERAYVRKVMRMVRARKRREKQKRLIRKLKKSIKIAILLPFLFMKRVGSFGKRVMTNAKKRKVKIGEGVHRVKRVVKKEKVPRKSVSSHGKRKTHRKKPSHYRERRNSRRGENQSRKRSWFFRFLKWVSLFAFFLIIVGGTAFAFWFSSLKIPSVDNFKERKIANSTKIYDRTGKILLFDIHKDIRRTVVPSEKISRYAKEAIIAIEDHNFYKHSGVLWKSTIRAAFQTLLAKLGLPHGKVSGGSTLTQQVVKNTLLTRERTITRKIKEWILAYKLEKQMTKDEILTTYLNEAPYGGTIYGIQEASTVYFGKPASDLTLAEAAYLAAIPNLPTYYSPYGQHRDELRKRQRLVLSKMREYGFITNQEYRDALKEEVQFLPREVHSSKAMHFVQYVRSLLEEKYGSDMIENSGLKVITTLDYPLQKKAEDIIKKHVEEVESENATNAALVAIDAKNGDILTMVGSRDYFDTEDFDGNFNVALSPRQAGSAFKPIAYATAFEKGYLPETAIFDVQTQFNAKCKEDYFKTKNGCYAPGNWDNTFKGPLTLREALAQSRNIPAIKVMHLAGLSKVMEKAREMGISSLNRKPSFYGLGLVLGGGDVSLLEMVSAYTTFAQEGVHSKPRAILEVRDINGEKIYESEVKRTRVFSENSARMVTSILSDNVARTPLYGAHSYLYFGDVDVAGKTGTTNDKRDAWMIGYTDRVAVGVWTGNNDNTPMKKGSKLSMKPWRQFMDEVISEYGAGSFHPYTLPENFGELPAMVRGVWEGGTCYTINRENGKRANENTPEELRKEVCTFNPHTILHSIDKDHPQVPGRNSRSDPQYTNWEYGVQRYVREHFADRFEENPEPPREEDDGETVRFDLSFRGLEEEYSCRDVVDLELDFDGINEGEVRKLRYSFDGVSIGSTERKPFHVFFDLSDVPNCSDGEGILTLTFTLGNGYEIVKKVQLPMEHT